MDPAVGMVNWGRWVWCGSWRRAELRRRRASVLLLTLLVALIGAVVLAAAAGACRSATALERFDRVSRASDVEISVGLTTPAEIARFRHTKNVVGVGAIRQLTIVFAGHSNFFLPNVVPADRRPDRRLVRA